MRLKDILLEITESDTFQMYHGGQRWTRIPTEIVGSKKGRYECGVGINLTNSYNTARRYAGGSRVVHLVTIDKKFKRLENVDVPLEELVDFVKNISGMRHKIDIIKDLTGYSTRTNRRSISSDILNNLVINYEAGAGQVGLSISNFFVSKGADAHVEQQGGGEFWLVIFNPKIIKSVSVIDPKKIDGDFSFMLPQIK